MRLKVNMMNNPPLTLDKRALARLLSPILYKCESTLLRDIDRSPELFPHWEKICGKKIFQTDSVVAFYPPGVGAAIRRARERGLDGKEGKSKVVQPVKNKPRPPMMRSLAEDLMAATAGAV
jgi:hypothetical protein